MALDDPAVMPTRPHARDLRAAGSFQYSNEFRRQAAEFLRGMEKFPQYSKYLRAGLGGPDSRLMQFVRYLCPEIEYRCGPLSEMKILDFGCGSGCSTAALAFHSKSVIGFDVDEEMIDLCRLRMAEHGLESRVQLYCASSLEEVRDLIGSVDLVLLCGVVEHLPLTDVGLRRRIIRTLFEMLNDRGCMYIYDTPNRLWPYDFHTTGLWGIPWSKPGSTKSYERAVRKGRYMDSPRYSPGPRGMEQCGAWGATYWEILEYLKGKNYTCVNTLPGNNRHIDYLGGARAFRQLRHPFDFFVGLLARPLRIPITAFYPFLDNLVVMKTDGVRHRPADRSARPSTTHS